MTVSSLLATLIAQEDGGGSMIGTLVVFALVPIAMYLLLIRPQRKRMKEHAKLQDSLGVGDEVITSAGIYGFITGEEDDRFWLEIDDDVQVRIAREAVRAKVEKGDDEQESDDDS